MQQPPYGYGGQGGPPGYPPPAGGFGGQYQGYPGMPTCARCGRPAPDHLLQTPMPVHRACIGLGPDTLSGGWIALAYLVTIPLGCTLIGALLASIPYYVWRRDYPLKARAYNKHVWIAFAVSCVVWIGWTALIGNSGR